jgi:hypothetical protein
MVIDVTKAWYADSTPPDTIRLYMHIEQVIAVS